MSPAVYPTHPPHQSRPDYAIRYQWHYYPKTLDTLSVSPTIRVTLVR